MRSRAEIAGVMEKLKAVFFDRSGRRIDDREIREFLVAHFEELKRHAMRDALSAFGVLETITAIGVLDGEAGVDIEAESRKTSRQLAGATAEGDVMGSLSDRGVVSGQGDVLQGGKRRRRDRAESRDAPGNASSVGKREEHRGQLDAAAK